MKGFIIIKGYANLTVSMLWADLTFARLSKLSPNHLVMKLNNHICIKSLWEGPSSS